MTNLLETINNPQSQPAERVAALKKYAANYTADYATQSQGNTEKAAGLPNPARKSVGENNNHIHTIYSFSPYTPSMAALRAKDAGLDVAGSVDHDSIGAAEEMHEACKILQMGCVTGFELRVSFKHTSFADKKINNPDSFGLVYMTIQGVPQQKIAQVKAFLQPLQNERHARNRHMMASLNKLLTTHQLDLAIDYERDVLPLSKANEGGMVTERHILQALTLAFINKTGKGSALVELLKNQLKVSVPAKLEQTLIDTNNPHYVYDVLGLLKSGFLDNFFIQPNAQECIPVEKVTSFARSIGAIPAYAYLGDIKESVTGDKKAEKFEDDFLDELFASLKSLGFLAITYMPPRNSIAQLQRVQHLCKQHDFMEISGVDINSSRQSFNCPELHKKEFAHLTEATWALVAHETLSSNDTKLGLFSPENPLAQKKLSQRITSYATIGQQLASGKTNIDSALKELV